MKKNNILNYLFICIVINIIPVALLKIFEIPSKIYTISVILGYMVQTLIMAWAVRYKLKETSKKAIIFFAILFILQVTAQIFNYLRWDKIVIRDIANIFSVLVNIYIFIYLCSKFKITKEEFISFMKKMLILGLISCIYNIFANWSDILNIFNAKDSYSVSISSFFPNRNQYGLFMLICIISSLYIIIKEKSKKYILTQILFIISLILTMSRNAILGLVILYGLYIVLNIKNMILKLTKKQKIILTSSIIVILLIGIILLFSVPMIWETIDKLFLRTDTISTGSGRTIVWKNGINITKNNPILGVGRFTGVSLNTNQYNSPLTQFHSIYIETLVSYGILGLASLVYLFITIIKKVLNSKIQTIEKKIMLSSIIVFLVLSCFETTCRFAAGYVDTIYMIFFFTIPLIYANIKSETEEIK